MRKCLILVVLVATSLVSAIPLDEHTRGALASAGTTTIQAAITIQAAEVKAEYESALLLFQEANATCAGIADAAFTSCKACVKSKCEARAEDVCSTFIGDFVNFWAEDFADFWADDFVDFWADDFTGFFANDVADFFIEDFAGAFEDLGGSLESGFADIGKGLGGAFEDIGGAIEGAVGDIGDAFEDIGDFIVDDIGDWFAEDLVGGFEDIGNFFDDLFGKKKRSLNKRMAGAYLKAKLERRKRASQPSCDELKDDANTACLYYVDECASCAFSADADCPGYADSKSQAQAAAADGAWVVALSESDDHSYGITSVEYDFANINHATGAFSNAEITVSFFGTTLSFTLADSVVFYNVAVTGPIIAEKALEEFIASF